MHVTDKDRETRFPPSFGCYACKADPGEPCVGVEPGDWHAARWGAALAAARAEGRAEGQAGQIADMLAEMARAEIDNAATDDFDEQRFAKERSRVLRKAEARVRALLTDTPQPGAVVLTREQAVEACAAVRGDGIEQTERWLAQGAPDRDHLSRKAGAVARLLGLVPPKETEVPK